jgi:3-oxoacyl-[acyl-carrier protein] reductase
MTKKLSGKVALVTGGSRGIGAASARAPLADEGASVASYVASPDKAEAVVRELKAKGVEARAYKADQGSTAEVDQLVKDVARDFGHLDILVNNAGVAAGGAVDDANADTAALARQDAVNVHGVVTAIRAASRLMGEGGRIVTIGSFLATRASFPGLADYTASKAAIVGYSKGAARDLGPRGITVNVVQPGSIDTDMNPDDDREFAEAQRKQHALQRFGKPEEIAAGVVFLASPQASFVTGAVLDIDGGVNA